MSLVTSSCSVVFVSIGENCLDLEIKEGELILLQLSRPAILQLPFREKSERETLQEEQMFNGLSNLVVILLTVISNE